MGQGVAPPTSGYGNQVSPLASQQRPGNQSNAGQPNAGQPNAGQPNAGQFAGNPNTGRFAPGQGNVQGQAQGFAPQGNTAMNPALNPALNQRPGSNPLPKTGSGQEVVTKNPWMANPPSPQEEAYLDQILKKWEESTADIQRYSCLFRRWQYNSSDNFVAELAKQVGRDIRELNVSVANGELRYMAPDKGMFKIDPLLKLSGQLDVKNQPEYKEFNGVYGEWWMCDGEKVYEYDRNGKKCTRFTMPPDLKGAGILESPMPFMFGVKAEKVRARYWVRALAPTKDPQGNEVFVVEAYPKLQSDAVNYDHVQIYLDRELFLPIRLDKFNTEHLDKTGQILNDNREVFEFRDRITEGSRKNILKKIGELFNKSFIPLDIPNDWKIEDRVFAPPAVDDVRAASNPDGPQPNNAPIVRK